MTLEDLLAETIAKFKSYKMKRDAEDAEREERLKATVIALRDMIPPEAFEPSNH